MLDGMRLGVDIQVAIPPGNCNRLGFDDVQPIAMFPSDYMMFCLPIGPSVTDTPVQSSSLPPHLNISPLSPYNCTGQSRRKTWHAMFHYLRRK